MKYDDEVISRNRKRIVKGKGIDQCNTHVVVSHSGGGRELIDIFKILVKGVCIVKSTPV